MKTKNIFSILFVAVMSALAFTSCNFIDDPISDSNRLEDKCESSTISGQWHGNFGMRYTYEQYGSSTTYDSYSTDIVFYPNYNGATSGWGQQVDSYTYGPFQEIQHKFDWSIRNGVIYLSYPYDHRLDCSIRNYDMCNATFSGYFSTGTKRFSMTKMLNNYNWGAYTGNYSTKVSVTFSFTRATRSGNVDAETNSEEKIDNANQNNNIEQGAIVKYSNRFAAEDSDF